TYLEEKDKYTLSSLKYKIGETEYSVEGFDPDIQEYTVNLPVNTFYVALLPEAIGEITCTIQDINDSPNIINGVSFGKMRTDTTGPAYAYERKAVKGIVPIKNENTKAFINVTDGENTTEYTINFRSVQPRLTEYNLVGADGDSYVPVFTSGAGFNNDNGTICAADRVWAAANISKKLIGASYFMSPYNNKGGGQWWNDVGTKGDEYFNFTADTAGTVYLLASSNLSEYSDWEKVNNGTVPTHPKGFTLGNKTWNDYDDTDYFMSCVKWNSNIGRCDECGVGTMEESQTSYIDGCVPYRYVFAKHFEAGEKVSIGHTGAYGNSAAEIIWAIVWDIDVNYPVVPDEPEEEEPEKPEADVPEGIKNIASYALDGYLYNHLKNSWAEVKLEDSTDEATGVITTTASNAGTLASGKRIATFQPWADYQGIGASAAGAYTMHFGFTVEEITSPVYLEYNYSRDGGYKKTVISLSDSKVVAGNGMSGSTFVEVQAPYTINIFMNIKTCEGYIYVNDKLLYKGNMKNSGADIKWREVRVFSLEESTDIKFVTTAANGSVYNDGITIQDVINAYMGTDEPGEDKPGDDETDENIPEGIKKISSYALNGYKYKQINNFWAESVITREDSTDASGVITSTASNTGALASGKRIATFQPWEERQGVGANAAGDYTMHFGFTVNEITSPLCLEYNYNRDGGYKKTLISFSDSKVVAGDSMSGGTFVEVQAPYTINMFMNVATCEGYIYVNDKLLYQGNMRNSGADTKWREVRVFSLVDSTDIEFVTTAANCSIYNEGITIQDVINAYMNTDKPGENPVDPPVTPDEPGDEVVKSGPVLDLDAANNAGEGIMDETSVTWADLSENGYDVTLTDVCAWTSDALVITNGTRKEEKAVLLSDKVNTTINSYNFTVEFDIASIDEGSVVAASKNEEFSICEEKGKLAFYFAGIVKNTISVSLEDALSGYNQITVSYDKNSSVSIKWYIDGELKAEKSVTLASLKTIDSLMLGSYGKHYSGTVAINKFRIFDYTKTAEDMAE
ncbi:MAG: hypothetical protein IJB96_08245, partial [Lachnospira sp.]|nr:hypothetical protein [Lachnospira sp.]